MSKPEASGGPTPPDQEEFRRLEEAVEASLAKIGTLQDDLSRARGQVADMEGLLRKFTGGEEDPSRLLGRLRGLEEENRVLLHRLQKGKEGAERLLARIRFLEEQG